MQIIEYYLLRGHDHDKLIGLTETEKWFYHACMIRELEREAEKYKQLFRESK